MSRHRASLETALARWIAARPLGERVAKLVGGAPRVRLGETRRGPASFDPYAALAEVRIGGLSIVVAAASLPIRALAQRLLGGPAELAAPRPLSTVEHGVWTLLVAAAITDAGIAADVWPASEVPRESLAVELVVAIGPPGSAERAIGAPSPRVATTIVDRPRTLTAIVYLPAELTVRAPPARAWPAWRFDVPIVVARCALPRAAVRELAVRDVVVVERSLALWIGDGRIELDAAPRAVEARVASGYVRGEMALPDDAHLELTVQLGSTRLSLRQLADLAIGQVVPLGRPLAGPYEIRAGGRAIGEGELVDVDGELGVRIVSLTQE